MERNNEFTTSETDEKPVEEISASTAPADHALAITVSEEVIVDMALYLSLIHI